MNLRLLLTFAFICACGDDAAPPADSGVDLAQLDGAIDAPTDTEVSQDAADGRVDDAGDDMSDGGTPDLCVVGAIDALGDTSPCIERTFPEGAFWNADGTGGHVIDLTRPPFNAVGDGVADDTAALRAAFDFILEELNRIGWNNFFPNTSELAYTLYLPDGTYRVTDTIIYNGPAQLHPVGAQEALIHVRITGQSREGTHIVLDPNVPSFGDAEAPKPVLAFGKTDFNNVPAGNSLRNLTVRVGAGNPGAVGVYFGGANASDIHNVRIVSEDGQGAIGLDNSIGTVLSYQRDLIVDGFDVGIQMTPYHFTMPTIEHVTLSGQGVAGVRVVNGTAVVRSLLSNNRVPAALLSEPGNHLVLIDSALRGGDDDEAAMQLDAGHLFARNVEVEGYGAGVLRGESVEVAGSVDEFVSDDVVRFSADTPARSMGLPIEEVPRAFEEPPADWALPDTAGDGVEDATDAIRAAIATGAHTIYFPGHAYRTSGTIRVPCSVRRMRFQFTSFEGSPGNPRFLIEGPCDEPLTVQDGDMGPGTAFAHEGPRVLSMHHIESMAFAYRSTAGAAGTTLFMTMVTGIKSRTPFMDQRVFFRAFNGESREGQLVCSNADCWVLGFKSEKWATVFEMNDGARLEVLGGIMNQYGQGTAPDSADWPSAIINDRAEISVVAATNGPNQDVGFDVLVEDIQPERTRRFRWDGPFPARVGRQHQAIIPLYVSY